jgi:hypothetical protein
MSRLCLLLASLCLAPLARAAIEPGDLPGSAEWYLHADLAAMRETDSGKGLYRWLEDEVFAEIESETGIDPGREIDSITAFAEGGLGAVLVIEGPISTDTRDKLLAMAAAKAKLDTLTHDGQAYYHVYDPSGPPPRGHTLEEFEDSAWFTFAARDKLIVTSEEEQLRALLDSGGRITGGDSHAGALFVLTADKEFVQAGAHTAELADDEGDWDSNILRNTEKAALLISDARGLLAFEARLVSKDPTITQSLGGIINGLIGLQSLNDDLDPEILGIIRNTKVEILENVLSVSTVFDPGLVVRMLDEHRPERTGSR